MYYRADDPTIVTRPKVHKPDKKVMEPIYYEALTKRKNQEQAMKAVLNEMVTYFIYVSIIFMLAYGNRDHSLFLQKQQLETTIIFGKY